MALFRRSELFVRHRDLLPEYGLSLEELSAADSLPLPDPAALTAAEDARLDFLRQLDLPADTGPLAGGEQQGEQEGEVAALRAAIADLDAHPATTASDGRWYSSSGRRAMTM